MPQAIAPILPLPVDVAAQINASAAITSLCGVVIGLVENSLDAEATKIEANVDFRRGTCIVEDDGHGIAPSEFSHSGGLGKPHRMQCSITIYHGLY